MRDFFYKNWILYYILAFLLIGILVYALLWEPICNTNNIENSNYESTIQDLTKQLNECKNNIVIDTTSVIDCNATVESGGKGKTETTHNLGTNHGKVIIEYNMQNIPDHMTVFLNNKVVAETNGLVRGNGILEFNYNPTTNSTSICKVIVDAPQEGTEWKYIVNCPN